MILINISDIEEIIKKLQFSFQSLIQAQNDILKAMEENHLKGQDGDASAALNQIKSASDKLLILIEAFKDFEKRAEKTQNDILNQFNMLFENEGASLRAIDLEEVNKYLKKYQIKFT